MNEQATGIAPPIGSNEAVQAAPTDLSAYRLEFGPGERTPEQLATDTTVRHWLQAAGLDGPAGSSFAEYARTRAIELRSATADDLLAQRDRAWTHIEQVYGDKALEKVDSAQRLTLWVESQHPGVIAFLDAAGLSSDPIMTMQMIRFAEEQGY